MNKKGFTLVELIVSFVLITIISIFLFQVISIITNIYNAKGIITELTIERSNISNYINKDIYLNEVNSNEIKEISIISPTEINIVFYNNTLKTLIVDKNNLQIIYDGFAQKFKDGTSLGDIEVDYDYVSTSSLFNNGVLNIRIPVSYNGIDDNFDVLIMERFSSSKLAIKR